MSLTRLRVCVVLALALTACGGSSTKTPTTSSTSIPVDPKAAVKEQVDAVVTSYLDSVTRQIPTVTSKVSFSDLSTCVKGRVDQFIDSAQKQQGQPDAAFVESLMNQAQGNLYSIVGMCAQLSN